MKRAYADTFADSTCVTSLSKNVAGYQPMTEEESRLNEILKQKVAELPSSAIENSFLSTKGSYDSSAVFKLLHPMPKGAILHTHSIATGCFKELANYIKSSEHQVWAYTGEDKRGPPNFLPTGTFRCQTQSPGPEWIRADKMDFDDIYKSITLPAGLGSVEKNWDEFFACWDRVNGLMCSAALYFGEQGFLYHILEEQWRTGVMYVEIKETTFVPYRMMDGRALNDDEMMTMFKDTVDKFKDARPGFIGARCVLCHLKIFSEDSVREAFRRVVALKAKFPDYVAGFDMAGPEDAPTASLFAQAIEEERQKSPDAAALPLLPHAGETNDPSARQVVEAVSLDGVVRIGHGFAIARWPHVLQQAIEKDICLEVNPLSNQVLGYFPNLATHPAPGLLRSGIPMSISADDPGMWHYSDVTYDWVAATKAWNLNLAELRALAKNSITYSTLSPQEKEDFVKTWEAAWNQWVSDALAGKYDL